MTQIVHGSSAAVSGQGVLILGASGAGKSTLLLQLLAIGADLVADDRVSLTLVKDVLYACAAPNLSGMIEARGIGILAATAISSARIRLIVDLDQPEPDRLPPRRSHHDYGTALDLVLGKGNLALAPAIKLLLQGARIA